MDLIDPILGMAEKLYDLCGEVKANKKRCGRLAKRVLALATMVEAVKKQGLGNQPELVQRGLRELKLTLESAQDVVKKYASSSCLKRIVKAYDLGEEFGCLNERLNDAAQLLSLALQVEQRERMERVFQEASRRKEDEEDMKCDREELQNLLQSLAKENHENKVSVDAVHVKVDRTHRDIQDIKGILESLRRPSIHLQDIREIKPEEITYGFPIKPFMKCCNSELFKGEYNKFTVAIKRYTYPVSTSPSQVRCIFSKEVETMKRFESPHILRMFGICVQDENGPNPNYLIVMEFCEKGNLRQVLDSPSKLLWDRKTQMCLDAAQGLYRLHQSEENFKVHGCINSSKFLVAAGYRVKLAGFELAKTETSLKKSNNNKSSSRIYTSPQQLENINYAYDKACEMYSFGIVMWEIATRQVPFKDCTSHTQIYKKVCEQQIMEPLPNDCPRELKDLIDACRSYNPFQRPSAGVLVDKLRKLAQQYEED
ncbi:mixed lineage kinase domain-like protein [Salminus brasiliensis]|uniref:mixed lineage kinase domain-like protein n=1 Tax=Salminus brasiliensis TaxID=930266 RepID=UPI003B830AE6